MKRRCLGVKFIEFVIKKNTKQTQTKHQLLQMIEVCANLLLTSVFDMAWIVSKHSFLFHTQTHSIIVFITFANIVC